MRIGEPAGRPAQAGFAYVLLLLAVALISIAAMAAVSLGATMARRDAEKELLAIGSEFERALRSYAGTPLEGGASAAVLRGPRSLEELLKDPRVPGVRRHLRQLYADPLTGRQEWGLVIDPQGFIVGIHSLAEGLPIKQSGFEGRWVAFENAKSYGRWVFAPQGPQLPAQ